MFPFRSFSRFALSVALTGWSLCGLTLSPAVQAQNLFETDTGSNSIIQITPLGVKTTFATGLNRPSGLAFDTAGNLFEADFGGGNIFKFTEMEGQAPDVYVGVSDSSFPIPIQKRARSTRGWDSPMRSCLNRA